MHPDMKDLWRVFGRIGVLSFGGPAAQIALMHKELVEERPWLTEKQFLGALSFCMLLPGPEAMQLATYCGWKLRGVWGGLIAGSLFVVPGALVILALALLYISFGEVSLVQAAFLGVKAAVVAIVFQALWKVSQKALKNPVAWVLAVAAFVAIFFFNISFVLIICCAALFGAVLMRQADDTSALARAPQVTLGATFTQLLIWSAVWAAPIILVAMLNQSFLLDIALFFSRLAVVTFGGAYAVLAYMTQMVTLEFGWLSTPQMMDALGLAETTPGPLILVTEFVGLLAGYQYGGYGLMLLAGALTLWCTFVPCFLWIFVAAPYVEAILAQPALTAALKGITVAVVGVILNLSLWFALHVLFAEVTQTGFGVRPVLQSLDLQAIALVVLSCGLLIVKAWSLPKVLATTSGVALLLSFL